MKTSEIIIREAEWSDLEKIIQLCGPNPELQGYKKKYYSDSGEEKLIFTGYPDEVWVAEYKENIIGFLHFYTDCYDGYERIIVSLQASLSLPVKDAVMVREHLKEAMLDSES